MDIIQYHIQCAGLQSQNTTKMTHCPNTLRLHCKPTFHSHTCTVSHTHTIFSHLFPQLNHTVQLKQVGPENHIAFHTEHAGSPTAHGAWLWCCAVWITSDMGRRRGRETDYWQLSRWKCSCCRAYTLMNGWEGWGWVGAVLGNTFTPREAVTKVAQWCHSHWDTLFIPSPHRVTREGEKEGMQRGKK